MCDSEEQQRPCWKRHCLGLVVWNTPTRWQHWCDVTQQWLHPQGSDQCVPLLYNAFSVPIYCLVSALYQAVTPLTELATVWFYTEFGFIQTLMYSTTEPDMSASITKKQKERWKLVTSLNLTCEHTHQITMCILCYHRVLNLYFIQINVSSVDSSQKWRRKNCISLRLLYKCGLLAVRDLGNKGALIEGGGDIGGFGGGIFLA